MFVATIVVMKTKMIRSWSRSLAPTYLCDRSHSALSHPYQTTARKAWESHFLNLVQRSSTWVRKRDQRNQTWCTLIRHVRLVGSGFRSTGSTGFAPFYYYYFIYLTRVFPADLWSSRLAEGCTQSADSAQHHKGRA